MALDIVVHSSVYGLGITMKDKRTISISCETFSENTCQKVARAWRWMGWGHASLSHVMKKVLIVISLSFK